MESSIKIVVFASPLHDSTSVMGCRESLLNELRSSYNTEFIDSESLPESRTDNEYIIAFIATGGVEEQFKKRWKTLSRPILLLSDSYHNSLAASMEISTWLYQNKIPHRHFNFPIEPTRKYLDKFEELLSVMFKIQETYSKLAKMRIGLIGGESSWLISSAVECDHVSQKYGTTFVKIDVSEVEKRYKSASLSENLKCRAQSLSGTLCKDSSINDVEEALKMYSAIKEIVKDFSLDALTIKCFDLLESCSTTSCLALSLLNDEGIISGCEGDIPSLWSMILARLLCGSASFMSNPSSIERADKSIDFAHCTAPLSMGKKFALSSHYESKQGIGVALKLPLDKFTLFKCGGPFLNNHYAFNGEIIQNTNVVERCRTQVKYEFSDVEEIDLYLDSHLGNHSILIPGWHKDIINTFFSTID
ncbi:MAG: hypothetical protein M0R37_09065 [Bacteroidales bacterium]|nr:hypothetical protein [Bacteroidales bacterium]